MTIPSVSTIPSSLAHRVLDRRAPSHLVAALHLKLGAVDSAVPNPPTVSNNEIEMKRP